MLFRVRHFDYPKRQILPPAKYQQSLAACRVFPFRETMTYAYRWGKQMSNFIVTDRKTDYLLPPSVDDGLNEDPLAR
jgi:hypothetical protein